MQQWWCSFRVLWTESSRTQSLLTAAQLLQVAFTVSERQLQPTLPQLLLLIKALFITLNTSTLWSSYWCCFWLLPWDVLVQHSPQKCSSIPPNELGLMSAVPLCQSNSFYLACAVMTFQTLLFSTLYISVAGGFHQLHSHHLPCVALTKHIKVMIFVMIFLTCLRKKRNFPL